ncbi:MAG: 2-amino-4-hydroxy-6-hydroxymethyldihydropteridine diphosphokinase [Chitinophagaceae bacterium]
MNRAYLLTGSNLNDPGTQLSLAFDLLQVHCGTITAASSIYGSAPWGIRDQPEFMNQAICLETEFPATTLLKKILAIEKEMGRERLFKMGPRKIDIDILLFNDDLVDEPGLTIPHPLLPQRRFALEPLSEIAPLIIHPGLKKSIETLLQECTDPLNVYKICN